MISTHLFDGLEPVLRFIRTVTEDIFRVRRPEDIHFFAVIMIFFVYQGEAGCSTFSLANPCQLALHTCGLRFGSSLCM